MSTLPWYRHRWPWIIMAGPAAVVVAGAITTWIAFATADGLVAEDYYKQGLGINKVIAREEAALKMGLSAQLSLTEEKIRVELKGAEPPVLFAHLAHGTRAGHDVRLRLLRGPSGAYEAEVPPSLPAGRWRIAIEDAQGRWRIAKELR
jgi:uncharacterized protein